MGGVLSKVFSAVPVPQALTRVLGVLGRSLRAGLVYGTKVRLPHAVTIAALFKLNKGMTANLVSICGQTWEHARNLAVYATGYKLAIFAIRWMWTAARLHETVPPADVSLRLVSDADGASLLERLEAVAKEVLSARPGHPMQAAIAGGLVAHFVWGRYSTINYQILLYVLSRVVISVGRLLSAKGVPPFSWFTFEDAYPTLSVAVWAAVMVLFEFEPNLLQGSMRRSMEMLYHQDGPEVSTNDFIPSPVWSGVAAFVLAWAWRRGGIAAVLEAFQIRASPARP
jgi:peroxisomal membrane protein 4